jgi:hypothetical protein
VNTNPGRRPRLSPLLLALAVSLAVAACGSSSGGGTKTSTTASAAGSRAKLTACLKQHGVTLPTRRPGAGRGFFGGGAPPGASGTTGSGSPPTGGFGGSGGGLRSSKFRTAFKDCGGSSGRFQPGASGAGRRFSGANLDKFVTCVRKHGYSLPKPNTSGKGAIFPRSIESNKKFQAAASSCASLLRPSTPSGTGTTTTSSS